MFRVVFNNVGLCKIEVMESLLLFWWVGVLVKLKVDFFIVLCISIWNIIRDFDIFKVFFYKCSVVVVLENICSEK